MNKSDSRLYSILPEQGYFDAGVTGDGRQVLMGLYCPKLIAIFFDPAGDFLRHDARHLEFLQPSGVLVDDVLLEGIVRHYDIDDKRIPPRLVGWQEELDFRPATIRLKRFFVDSLGIGIEDHPDYFGEVLDDPSASDEEKDDIKDSIQQWNADGQFVLHWGNDYWLNDSGEVVSS